MPDSKSNYSSSSTDYVNNDAVTNDIDIERAKRSKEREEKYNENWKQNMVNINEVVDKFCPGVVGKTISGVKFVYKNENYIIECDKVAGYLRIYDRKGKCYVKADGTPGSPEETHLKIKKREEM